MKTSLKYQRTNLTSIREILKTRNGLAEEVLRRGLKEPGPYVPKPCKEKIAVDTPSKEGTVLLYQLGAYNCIMAKECRSAFNQLGCSLSALFRSLGRLKLSSLDTSRRIWQDMIEF
jgi:hypothetical protein